MTSEEPDFFRRLERQQAPRYLHADLGFPLCHDLGHRNPVHELDLVLQLLSDTAAVVPTSRR
jgi:hypothetical protein